MNASTPDRSRSSLEFAKQGYFMNKPQVGMLTALKSVSNPSKKMVAALLVIIMILGSFSLYLSLVQLSRTRNIDAVEIFSRSSRSVVTVRGVIPLVTLVPVTGTGFVVSYNNSYYVITNFHVIDGVVNSTVTFSNGGTYRAEVVGSDSYSDLAIVSVKSPTSEFYPIQLGSSSALKVGEPVAAIGNPFGLSGSITTGIVSQVGRSVRSESSGQFVLSDMIQFSASVNPGNSGGPVLNADGMVVGMTTSIIVGSQGVGFAVASDTINRELPFLVKNGKYDRHPYLGVRIAEMNYQLSQVMRTNLTWGVLIQDIVQDGPANKSGLRGGARTITIEGQRLVIGGDIIVSLDGNRIVDYDALSTYLERHAIPGQTIQVGIVRAGNELIIPVELGARPPIR